MRTSSSVFTVLLLLLIGIVASGFCYEDISFQPSDRIEVPRVELDRWQLLQRNSTNAKAPDWYVYWFMFPISILVATTALTFGIGGAVFFSPIFIILFPMLEVPTLTPADAFGAALLTELAGFASGLAGYLYRKYIDWKTGGMLLMLALPMAVLGTIAKRELSHNNILLLLAFSMGMLLLAAYSLVFLVIKQRLRRQLIEQYHSQQQSSSDETISLNTADLLPLLEQNYGNTYRSEERGEDSNWCGARLMRWVTRRRTLVDRKGQSYSYSVCRPMSGMFMISMGGFVTGTISVGIGETAVTTLNAQCGLPMNIAAGTSVLIVTCTVLASNATDFIIAGSAAFPWRLIIFTVPGVLIGGQIGALIASKMKGHTAEVVLIILFVLLSMVMGAVVLNNMNKLPFHINTAN